MLQIEALAIRPGILLQQRYLVTKQLGRGGFGATFEVDDRGTAKVLKVLLTNYPKAVSLFQREAEVLSQLRHPGIPKVEPQSSRVILQRLRGELFSCITGSTKNLQNITTKQGWHKRPLIRFGFAALSLLGICGWRFGLPQIAIAYNDRGVEHYLAAQPNQALLDFNIAVKLDPNFAEAYYNRGMIYDNLRDFDRARTEYQIAAKGGIPEAYNNLARLYILQKNYAAAVDLIGQGMKQTKLNKEMKYVLQKNLGWARLEQNRYVEAKKHLQMAINEDRDRGVSATNLKQHNSVLYGQSD